MKDFLREVYNPADCDIDLELELSQLEAGSAAFDTISNNKGF